MASPSGQVVDADADNRSASQTRSQAPPLVGETVGQILAVPSPAPTRRLDSTRRFSPAILAGWTRDMWLVCRELRRVRRPGGLAAVVIAEVASRGVIFPSLLVLADVAVQGGLQVNEVSIARRHAISAQQAHRHGNHHRQETVVWLRRETQRMPVQPTRRRRT